jgi:translocation and assembly module TamA
VPDTQRFRAGGDDSVRGYEYRSLAPIVGGVVTSGDVLFTASAEIARPITPRLPGVWGAVFIDAGRAADRWGDLDPAVGYGVGVRYRSPIGPLKIDLARGHETGNVRLHFTVGVTF